MRSEIKEKLGIIEEVTAPVLATAVFVIFAGIASFEKRAVAASIVIGLLAIGLMGWITRS